MSNFKTEVLEAELVSPPPGQVMHDGPRVPLSSGRWILHQLPTLLVLGALAALAVWGHHVGWKLPKFSNLTGTATDTKDDWCEAHSVPESACVECNADLMPKSKSYGWCKKHGIHECPLEHPDVAQLEIAPQITQSDLERADKALEFLPRSENNSQCKLHQRRIQFASDKTVEKAGIDVDSANVVPITEAVSAHGEVAYDQTRVARLSARLPGSVWRVEKQVGDQVKKGEILALVDAVEVGRAKAEFLQALVQVNLKHKNLENLRKVIGSIPERTLQESEAALEESRIRLLTAEQNLVNLGLPIHNDEVKGLSSDEVARRIRFLGLGPEVTRSLDLRTTTTNLLPVKAPLDGTVVAREVVAGEVVDSSKLLFIVADTSRMWLTLHVRLEDVKSVALGQEVRFLPDGSKDEVTGKVTWIGTAVDPKTRTVQVRAELPQESRARAKQESRAESQETRAKQESRAESQEARAKQELRAESQEPRAKQESRAESQEPRVRKDQELPGSRPSTLRSGQLSTLRSGPLSTLDHRLLLANTFGSGRIILREEEQAVVVPNEAVHWEGHCHIVFVRDKNYLKEGAFKVFHVRKVRPGVKDESHTEIIAGVLPHEVVASKGSGILRAELLKANLGEG